MQEQNFKNYLKKYRNHSDTTIRNRTSNCKNVERYYGDLEAIYLDGKFGALLDEFIYSVDEARENVPARHRVIIDGDVRNGTATLKQALTLYKEFREAQELGFLDDENEETQENDIEFEYERD